MLTKETGSKKQEVCSISKSSRNIQEIEEGKKETSTARNNKLTYWNVWKETT